MDKRKNAQVTQGNLIEIRHYDHKKYLERIEHLCKGFHSLYLFSGTSPVGDDRIDINPNSNATILDDVFLFLEKARPNVWQRILYDPPFECYNPNRAVWENAIKKGILPESSRHSIYFGHPHEWRGRIFELLPIGGIAIGKINATTTQKMAKFPNFTIWWLEDSRPNVTIFREDYKH